MYGNCVLCERFASLNRYKICDTCFETDEEYLQVATKILREDGHKNVFELAEDVEIEPERIFLWVDQKRILTSSLEYLCPKCGGDILKGICDCQLERFLFRSPEELEPEDKTGDARCYSNRRVLDKCKEYWDYKSRIKRRQKRDIWVPS